MKEPTEEALVACSNISRQGRMYKIKCLWLLRGPILSTEVSTVRQIKRPGTGMMQLVLQETKGRYDDKRLIRRQKFDKTVKV